MATTRDTVLYKVQEMFAGSDFREIMRTLDLYGTHSHEQEPHRVQLAVLKLSGGKLNRLEEFVRLAKTNYSDVLAWGEFPRVCAVCAEHGYPIPAEQRWLASQDRLEYHAWLGAAAELEEIAQ